MCSAESAAKKRILFVDDEPDVLSSIRNVLRRDSGRWEMIFALGGERALDELRQGAFDAVISDMRMPDVDGATLLAAIRRDSPTTVRILLTGYAHDADLERILPDLHELLTKPCTAATLRATIDRHLARRCGAAGGNER